LFSDETWFNIREYVNSANNSYCFAGILYQSTKYHYMMFQVLCV